MNPNGDGHSDSHKREETKIWNCTKCNEELGELNGYCVYCKVKDGSIVYNPDKYYIRDVFVNHVKEAKSMTPQEELFKELFNHEKLLVKDMTILELRAHREELSKVAYEARARLTAVDDEEDNRKKKDAPKGQGFSRNLNTDETTTNSINTIKERQKKLTGKEKVLAGLVDLYMKGGATRADAEKIANSAMNAGNILARVKENKESKSIMLEEQTRSPLSQENGFVIQKSSEQLNPPQIPSNPTANPSDKKIFNPFEKKA